MGRRLNLSTPTVINTELIPLDESFYIEANGNTEQWYYDNTNVYAPNRNVIPLTLTPRLSVFDGDTKTTYTPTFYMVKWYAKEYNATHGEYVETQITTTDPAATDYVLSGNNLLVKKNVPYSHDVTIRCEATYTDPRDTGVTSTIQDTVTLLTNRDASTISPMLEIDCPASQGFNPLTATTSKYTLKGRASWGQDLANDNIVAFKADPLGTENIIPTNDDSIDSAAPTLSLRYGSINQAEQTFMSRQTSGGQVGNIEGNVGYVTNIKGDTVKLVQLVSSSSSSVTVPNTHKYYGIIGGVKSISTSTGASLSVTGGTDMILDLTAMGIDNLTTVEQVESWLATHIGTKSYYPYTEGRLINYGGYQVKMNQLVGANTTTVSTTSGHKYYAYINNTKSVITSSGSAIAVVGGSDFVIDLTLMFGVGNEPDLDWCNAHFTEDYYPYHTGYDTNLLSVTDEDLGIKTVGFNLFDESTLISGKYRDVAGIEIDMSGRRRSDVYFKCNPSTAYYFYSSAQQYSFSVVVCWYDSGKNYISGIQCAGTTQTSPSNAAYYRISNADAPDCSIGVSLSSSKNGTYEPYWESFTDTSWITKIGIENFNIWDEEWEFGTFDNNGEPITSTTVIRSKNFMPIQGNTAYYNNGAGALYFYDSSKTFISSNNTSNAVVTSPVNAAYFKLIKTATGYANDICINKSIAHFNGRYYPHGVTAPYFPNGLCNVGSVYDEIKVVDGKIKGVVRFYKVDLGDLTYQFISGSSSTYDFFASISSQEYKTVKEGGLVVSSVYTNGGVGGSSGRDLECYLTGDNRIRLRNLQYSDAATFKAAMAGVPLVYELKTPYEFEIDYPTKSLFEWYGVSNNVEVKADTLPWYVDGQNTDTLTVDAMYGEEIRVVLRAKKNYGTDLYPSKAYRSILWRIPDIDSSVLSENGSAVRSDTESMNFGTIVNIKGDTLSDDVKKEHLRFHWKSIRDDNTSTETDQGWGLTKELPASELINVKSSPSSRLASTIVYPEVYLLGAYEKVTDDGNDVTEDGELVYDRPVF